jgi:predicted TIM-barrel fold metal-dependent hydrolase
MLIVDSQVHIWKSGTPVEIHRQIPSYTQDDLLREMNEGGVDAALLHPPSWDANATEIAIEAARAHPDRLAVLGFFDPTKA